MEYVLTTENLSKSHGRFQALDQLSLHVPRALSTGLSAETARERQL